MDGIRTEKICIDEGDGDEKNCSNFFSLNCLKILSNLCF
jgi:hypothetical protein